MGWQNRGRSKFGNMPTEVDGMVFDSKAEAQRYAELKLMVAAKEIKDLRCQAPFLLQESFRDCDGIAHRPIYYIADFLYWDKKYGRYVVEEVKGVKSQEWRMKKKLFLYKYRDYKLIENMV